MLDLKDASKMARVASATSNQFDSSIPVRVLRPSLWGFLWSSFSLAELDETYPETTVENYYNQHYSKTHRQQHYGKRLSLAAKSTSPTKRFRKRHRVTIRAHLFFFFFGKRFILSTRYGK